MKHKPWKTRSSRPIYKNPWIDVREDVAEMPDGRTTIYGVVTFGDCGGVVPFVDDDHVLLVNQYRYATGGWVVEIPAGKLDPGEHGHAGGQADAEQDHSLGARALVEPAHHHGRQDAAHDRVDDRRDGAGCLSRRWP